MIKMHTAYIGYGANMGDRAGNIQGALDRLDQSPDVSVDAVSRLYETEPVDYEDQDWFLNGVARISTSLEPMELLSRCMSVEKDAGRTRTGPRFGPRVIDLDILFYDSLVMEATELTLPHPRLHKRRFVLTPLCDIASDLKHPVLEKTMQELLRDLDDGEKVVTYHP